MRRQKKLARSSGSDAVARRAVAWLPALLVAALALTAAVAPAHAEPFGANDLDDVPPNAASVRYRIDRACLADLDACFDGGGPSSSCAATSSLVSLRCHAAVHRFCLAKEHRSGWGVENPDDPTQVDVTCLTEAAGALFSPTHAELSSENASCVGAAVGRSCSVAVDRYCRSQPGFKLGIGPQERNATIAVVACVANDAVVAVKRPTAEVEALAAGCSFGDPAVSTACRQAMAAHCAEQDETLRGGFGPREVAAQINVGCVTRRLPIAACPASCGSGVTIAQHGGASDRYLTLEAVPEVPAVSTAWQRIDGPDDPFTPFDGLGDPTSPTTTVNRMLDRAYMVTVTDASGGTACACTQVDRFRGSFPFMVVADPQLGFLRPHKAPYLLENRHLDRAVDAANRLRPAFVAVVGDMVHDHDDTGQRDLFFERIGRLDKAIPLVLVAGNHELTNRPTQATLDSYRATYMDDRYGFRYSDSRFLVINSTLLDAPRFAATAPAYWAAHGTSFVEPEVADHMGWLEGALAAVPGEHHRIVLSHHPLFVATPDEADSSKNIHLAAREDLLQLFRQHTVSAVFAGHLHDNAVALDDPPAGPDSHRFAMITTQRVGAPPLTAGFRIVHVLEDRFEHTFHRLAEAPEILPGASWRYLDTVDNASQPPAGWTGVGFDDSAWAQGTGVLGYGAVPDLATTVDDGGSPRNVTTYFRRTFARADPGAFAEYAIDLLRDDGAVVYVNGVEMARPNMPGGAVQHTTLALTEVTGDPTFEAVGPVAAQALASGTNVVAVEVHQVSTASDDLAFDLALGGRDPAVLFEARSMWRYVDVGDTAPPPDVQGDAWFELGYGGPSLPSEAPFGDPGALGGVTPSCGPDDPAACGVTSLVDATPSSACVGAGSRTTVYFWQRFQVDDPNAFAAYRLHLLAEDGAVVYLNGAELGRPNMPSSGSIGPCTLASSTAGVDTVLPVAPGDLVAGMNVVAVEVHRGALTTTDLAFDLSLTADLP